MPCSLGCTGRKELHFFSISKAQFDKLNLNKIWCDAISKVPVWRHSFRHVVASRSDPCYIHIRPRSSLFGLDFFSLKTTWRQLFESQNPFDLEAKHIFGYQFKAASFVTNELIGPAVFFRMEMDPIRVTYYTEQAWNGEKLILVYPWGVCCVFLGKRFGWAAYSSRQKKLLIILKSWFWVAWQDTKKWHLYNQSDQADSCLTTFPCLGKISKSYAVGCNTTHSSMFAQVPWRQFLVNLCAVVGGCFAKLASTSPQNWHFGTPKLKQVLLKRNWLWKNLDIFSDCGC